MAVDAIDTIMRRRSIRSYKQKALPDKDLKTILEAGRQAPSAANRQPWHFVVVRDEENRRKLAEACNKQNWLADAGAIVAGVGKPSVSGNWYPVDVAIAMENMVIAATALGYGTCWIGAFDQAKVKELLAIPEEHVVVAITPIGLPGASPEARPRMELSEFASAERFGEKFG